MRKPFKYNNHITKAELEAIKSIATEWFELYYKLPDGTVHWLRRSAFGCPKWGENRHESRSVSLQSAIRIAKEYDDLNPVIVPLFNDAVRMKTVVSKYLNRDTQRVFSWKS